MRTNIFFFRSLAWSAYLCGGLEAVLIRPSDRSFSGWVLLARFNRPDGARKFARRWAARLGISVVYRSKILEVSVPVLRPHDRQPGLAHPIVACGGPVGFSRNLNTAGFPRPRPIADFLSAKPSLLGSSPKEAS